MEFDRDNDFERENAIDILVTETYMVSCLLTLTGLRFIIITSRQLIKRSEQTRHPEETRREHPEDEADLQIVHGLLFEGPLLVR